MREDHDCALFIWTVKSDRLSGLSRRSVHPDKPGSAQLCSAYGRAFWLQTFSCRDFSLALGGRMMYRRFSLHRLQRPVHF